MKITCVGDCGVDYHIDKKKILPGGITLNFAINLRKLSTPNVYVHIITSLGKDKEAEIVKSVIKKSKIIAHITVCKGKTPIQYIDHDKNGEKKFVKYDEGVLGDFTLKLKDKKLLCDSDYIVTPLYSQITKMFESVIMCKPRRIMAVDFMDLGDYNKSLDIVKKYINNFNYAFFGLKKEESALIGRIKNLSTKYSDKIFIVTLGKDGTIAFNNKREYYAKAYKVKRVLDTTGAGDAFAAAFISSMIKKNDIERAIDFGNKYASKIVQKLGGI